MAGELTETTKEHRRRSRDPLELKNPDLKYYKVKEMIMEKNILYRYKYNTTQAYASKK